jgi:hypothetical protein
VLAATGGPVSDRNPICHDRGCSGDRVRDPVRPPNYSRPLATVSGRPAFEPQAGVDRNRMTRGSLGSLNRRRADLVVSSEDPDRLVQGRDHVQLRWEQMMVSLLRLRLAAGVCVLAAGMLLGAGGAVADPGSSGSGAHGTNASGQQHSTAAKKPKDESGGTDTKDGSLGSGGQPDQQHSTAAKAPKDEPGGTDTKDGTTDDSGGGATVSNPVHAVANEVGPVYDRGVTMSDPVDAVPNEVAPVSESDAVAPVPDVVGPVSDVRASVQAIVSSVGGAVVPLTQLQSDLSSFLLGIAGVQPVVAGVGGVAGPGLSRAAGASVTSRLPLGLPLAGISGPPLAGASRQPVTGEATGVATLDVIALGRASAVSEMAPLTPDAAFSTAAGSSFRQVFGELLLPVSLWALAAVALPGVGGLVILFSTGARLGYRQAKAGFAVRTAGIVSFARSGAVPLGVVRSASLVVIRPRALRVVRPGALSADHLLDKVA